MLRYAIIGLGGLGKKHLLNLDALEKERGDMVLCGLCGANPEDFKKKVNLNIGAIDISSVDIDSCNFYSDYKELIDKEKPDFILSALPTYLHEEVATYALSKGAHVFSEKPMALSYKSCANMINAAKKYEKKLMIGQCLRFSPAFAKIKEWIESGEYGDIYRAEFKRYSATPKWTWNNWILDPAQSGGCAIDMHVHDVDIVHHLFGKPERIYSVETNKKVEGESIFSHYYYKDLFVSISADWSLSDNFPFTSEAVFLFEKATAVTDGSDLTLYVEGGEKVEYKAEGKDIYQLEMEEFLDMITNDKESEITSPESVMETIGLVEKELASAKSGKEIKL